MQILAMTIEANAKFYEIKREGDGVGRLRLVFPGGGDCLLTAVENREACFTIGCQIARHAYGQRRGGAPKCTNSMISDIADAIERVAGC